MRKFRKSVDQYLELLEKRWQKLPKAKQNLFAKIFFAGYVVMTFMVVLQLWFKGSSSEKALYIRHINNIPKEIVEKRTLPETNQIKIYNNGKYK
ncbi:hypothetical protein [Chryseobacterium sp.]|uniref:hypothetical protein n=1 Tax=Chryseobacterium sp. TaxID=1871047 RepID=UPI0028983AD1|nr:hypothetical protein [Chryseobacterium sp.]